MGLAPLWRLRRREATERATDPTEAGVAVAAPATAPIRAGVSAPEAPFLTKEEGGSGVVPASRTVRAVSASPAEPARTSVPVQGQDDRARIEILDWDALEEDMRHCNACGLCAQRRQVVPGVGDRNADWMFVGEGPGAEEDRLGEPFVGQAGKLLDAMLLAIGLERGKGVYIANAVKCRPPMNRTPESAEIAACRPYLERQIALVRPRILIALGRPAAQALLHTELRINAARGQAFEFGGIPVVVTYHPAYLLRNPSDKAKAWEDLCFACELIARETGDRARQ
ncbi:uracil-DNA glycosylase [Rhodocyclaceae bacterium SMB388]